MTTATGAKTYRPFLLEDGEKLLVTDDAITNAYRFGEFLDATGLDPADVVSEAVVGIPLPVYERGKRFAVSPDVLWHPLFWLPEELALRVRIQETPDAEPRVETNVEWAIRIAVELTESGLYDAEKGWLDVFALYGIDPANPEDLEAIQGWQFFLPDERLDNIDLRKHVTFTEDNAGFYTAQDLIPIIMPAQWALTASSILAAIEADQPNVGAYAELAAGLLETLPTDEPDELLDAAQAIAAGEDVAAHGPTIVAALEGVLAEYSDALDVLNDL